MGTQTGRETGPRFHQVAATLENFNRKKSVPGNANQSAKEQLKHTLLLRVAPSSITISSQQGCTCMWTTSQHKCQVPGYDLYSRPHPNWSVPSLPLTHLLKPQRLSSKLPKQTKFLAGSGPNHWHPPAFSYSWSTQLVPKLQTNYPCHWGLLNLRWQCSSHCCFSFI